MNEEMVISVAAALELCAARQESDRVYWRNMARAAIAAMHQPTEAMLKEALASATLASAHRSDSSLDEIAKAAWRAMIDAALWGK